MGITEKNDKKDLVLAENFMQHKVSQRIAFTLSEVLIAIGVIGVVAAVTLPVLITNTNQRMNSERQVNVAQKVTQAMEQMRAHGLLNTPYPTTESFVDELQKYLKVSKRCDNNHLAECWPTETVTTSEGESFAVADAKIGRNLSLPTDTNNVGLVLSDGGAIILNYDPNAKTLDVGDAVRAVNKSLPVGKGNKEFPYTTTVTSGIDFVMDVNGKNKPNSESDSKFQDIRAFNVASFSKCPGIKIPGLGCVVNVGSNYSSPETCITKQGLCHDEEVSLGGGLMQIVEVCTPNVTTCTSQYDIGAEQKCESLNMHIARKSELITINNYIDTISGLPSAGEAYFFSDAQMVVGRVLGISNVNSTGPLREQFIFGSGNIETAGDSSSKIICVE